MGSLEEQFDAIKHEDEIKTLRLQNAALRQVISCAVCAFCGEGIADQQWSINDNDELVHVGCEETGQP
jgi:hypothetical protein